MKIITAQIGGSIDEVVQELNVRHAAQYVVQLIPNEKALTDRGFTLLA